MLVLGLIIGFILGAYGEYWAVCRHVKRLFEIETKRRREVSNETTTHTRRSETNSGTAQRVPGSEARKDREGTNTEQGE